MDGVCAALGCEGPPAATVREEAIVCVDHYWLLRTRLERLGVALKDFQRPIADLLAPDHLWAQIVASLKEDAEHTGHIGRALGSESRLARRTLRAARVKQLNLELRLTRAQFDALSETASQHKTRNVADRLWQLQHRIDDLTAQIDRLCDTQETTGRSEGPGTN